MGDKSSSLFAFLFIAVLAVGCSPESATLYKNTRTGQTTVDTGQCRTGPYEGPNAMNPNGLHFVVEDTNYFGKPMVFDHLRALRNTSGWGTWNYARSLGVPIAKVQEETKSKCQYYAFMPSPDAENAEVWEQVSQSSGSGGSRLLGLFTTLIERNTHGQTRLVDPQIMVREDAHRWTLLHELGHYLFALEKVKVADYRFDREIENELVDTSRVIGRLQDTIENGEGSENDANKLVRQWNKFYRLSHELHIRGPLEEFSLESLLLEQYMNGKLKLIDERIEPLNAVAYMETNATDVLSRYRRQRDSIDRFHQSYFKEEWTSAIGKAKLIVRKLNKEIHFIENKMEKAKEFKESRNQIANDQMNQILFNVETQKLRLPHVAQHYDMEQHKHIGELFKETF